MSRRVQRFLALFAVFSAVGVVYAADPGAETDLGYKLVLFVHQLLFVFWLGPDIGVYMWSTKLTNSELSPAQRVSAGRIMQAIELIPRACMSLMLTVGGVLTELMGIEHPWWQMAGIWLLGPIWLTLTILVYVRSGSEQGFQLARLDEFFRWAVIGVVLMSVGYSVTTGRLAEVPWVTAKLLIFAAVVFFGLMMRRRLMPVKSAMDALESAGPTTELDGTIAASISRARPFMFASWIALAAAAALGMAQPGGGILVAEVDVTIEENAR